MKKLSLLLTSLLVLTLFCTSCKHSAKKWCPVGDPDDYSTISQNKKTEPYELASGKAYYGKGNWSPVMTTQTKGTWYFETGDSPVTFQYALKKHNIKGYNVNYSFEYKTDTVHYLLDETGTVTFPANTTSSLEYQSAGVTLGSSDTCFEFYIYCE